MQCSLSKEKLRMGQVCICKCGSLFNKEEVVKCLLEKRKMPEEFAHIRKLKDVRDVKMPKLGEGSASDVGIKKQSSEDELRLICPVTQTEYTGYNTFYVSWSCGCIVSENALKELNQAGSKDECLVCSQPITEKHVFMYRHYLVKINMSE